MLGRRAFLAGSLGAVLSVVGTVIAPRRVASLVRGFVSTASYFDDPRAVRALGRLVRASRVPSTTPADVLSDPAAARATVAVQAQAGEVVRVRGWVLTPAEADLARDTLASPQ